MRASFMLLPFLPLYRSYNPSLQMDWSHHKHISIMIDHGLDAIFIDLYCSQLPLIIIQTHPSLQHLYTFIFKLSFNCRATRYLLVQITMLKVSNMSKWKAQSSAVPEARRLFQPRTDDTQQEKESFCTRIHNLLIKMMSLNRSSFKSNYAGNSISFLLIVCV